MQPPPRERITRLATSAAIILLVLVLIPIWAVHSAVSTVRSRRKAGSTRTIPRLSIGEVDLEHLFRRGEPIILRGLIDRMDLTVTPDRAGLRRLASTESDRFKVRVHKNHSPYFLYTGDYGAELDHVEKMNLAEFLDFMFDRDAEPETCTYRLFSVSDLNGAMGAMIDDISDGLAAMTDRQPDRQACGIWVGSEGVVTPLHHDAWTGLLFQMSGSKRILMFSPDDRPNLSFTSPFAVGDRWSTLPGRSDDADPARHPRLAKATRYEATLEEGEVLFIPPFWSHEIEALEPNISIPFRFRTRPADHVNPGFLRPAYEIFHHRFLEDRSR
ncbi:MAG: cupin-like domain-containing protein [Acidimicrobiales bacterium]